MSRPMSPGVPGGGQPAQRPRAQEQAPPQGWPPQGQALPGWPPQAGQQGYQPPPHQPPASDNYAPSYHYPQQGQPQHEPYFAPQPPPQQQPAAGRPQNYAPQFERYATPPQQQAQHQAPPPRAPVPPQRPPQHAPQHAPQDYQAAAYRPEEGLYPAPPELPRTAPPRTQPPQQQARPQPDLRGSLADQWPTTQPPRHAQQADPRGYDLGAYGSPNAPGQYPDGPPSQPARQGGYQAHARQGIQPEAYDLDGYPMPAQAQQGRAVVADQDYPNDEIEYEDEPPRRSRGLLIVGALVGAIALGGGLAYGYKMFLAPQASGKTPIVKADKAPAKTQPADSGGKVFANQGVKVMGGRLTDGGDTAQSGASQGTVGDDGVRRVPTVQIRPDGSMAAPQPQQGNTLPPMANVGPGVTFVNPIPPPRASGQGFPQPQLPGQGAGAPVQPQVAQPPSQQRVISLPPPKVEAPAAAPAARPVAQPRIAAATTADDIAPPVKRQPVPKTSAATAASSSGGSFAVVLSSQRSQMDALKVFADLQQKYGVLQGKQATVQEANLGEKGVYHRLLVPAGARDQANALCTELKASGHKDCWVMAQ